MDEAPAQPRHAPLTEERKAVSDHYTYRVTWSPEDQEHAGLCAEFPSLSWLAASPCEALDGIRKLVGEVLEDMAAAGERPPAPFADRKYRRFDACVNHHSCSSVLR